MPPTAPPTAPSPGAPGSPGESAGGAGPASLSRDVHPLRAVLDVAVQLAGRLINLALGVVATAVLARGLGGARYGEWSTILLIPTLLALLNDLGLMQVAVRRASADGDARWLGALVTVRAVLSVPVTLTSIVVLLFVAHGTTMHVAGVIIALQGLLAAPGALGGVFQARVRNDLTMAILTLNSVLWTAAVVIIARRHGGLVPYAAAIMLISLATTVVTAVVARRGTHVPLRGTRALWPPLFRAAVPLSIGFVLIVAYTRIDGLIVYLDSGSVAAGLYGAATKLVDQSGFVPLSLVVTLTPLISRVYPADPQRARRLLQLALDLLAMVSLPAFAFSLAASGPSVALLFGPQFAGAARALPILMAAFVVICCNYAFGLFTLVLGLQRRFARWAFAALVFNVTLNVILVPHYGFVAAAWITLGSELLVVTLTGRAVFESLEMRPDLSRVARVVVAATVSGGAALVLARAGLEVLIILVITGLVHVAMLFLLRALSIEEISALLRRDTASVL